MLGRRVFSSKHNPFSSLEEFVYLAEPDLEYFVDSHEYAAGDDHLNALATAPKLHSLIIRDYLSRPVIQDTPWMPWSQLTAYEGPEYLRDDEWSHLKVFENAPNLQWCRIVVIGGDPDDDEEHEHEGRYHLPELRTLEVLCRSDEETEPRNTLSQLARLNVPKLESLTITTSQNSTNLSTYASSPGTPYCQFIPILQSCQGSLRRLEITDSTIASQQEDLFELLRLAGGVVHLVLWLNWFDDSDGDLSLLMEAVITSSNHEPFPNLRTLEFKFGLQKALTGMAIDFEDIFSMVKYRRMTGLEGLENVWITQGQDSGRAERDYLVYTCQETQTHDQYCLSALQKEGLNVVIRKLSLITL